MPDVSPEVAALKSGLGLYYGRLLAALERIADALEGANENPGVPTGRRKKDNPDA
jgi:hypothetical protein